MNLLKATEPVARLRARVEFLKTHPYQKPGTGTDYEGYRLYRSDMKAWIEENWRQYEQEAATYMALAQIAVGSA